MSETAPATVSSPSAPSGSNGSPKGQERILIVESDGFARLVLIFLFRMAGLGVDFTANGTLALSRIRKNPPDALLVELKLHGLPGADVIRKARQLPGFP